MGIKEELHDWYRGLQTFIYTTDEFQALRDLLPVKPENGSCEDLIEMHNALKPNAFWNDVLRSHLIHAIDQYTRQCLSIPSLSHHLTDQLIRLLHELDEKGHVAVGRIDSLKVEAMRTYFAPQKVIGPNETEISLEVARASQNIGGYPQNTVIQCPHLLEIASQPSILSMVEQYLGVMPTILVVEAWNSFANKAEARDAQFYHIDYDDYRFCKLFIYLTDVDDEAGPHMIVEGSHKLDFALECRKRNGDRKDDFDRWYWLQMRKTDDEVKRFTGREGVPIKAPAGSMFLVDTRALHKGLLPRSKDRLLAQVTYGVQPRLLQKIPRVKGLNNLEPRLEAQPFRYSFRLFRDN